VGNSQQPQGLVLESEFARHPASADAYEFDSRGVFLRGVINDVADGWTGPPSNPGYAHANGYRVRLNPNDDPNTPENESLPAQFGSPDWTCYTWAGQGNAGGPAYTNVAGAPVTCPNSRGAGLSADTRSSKQTNITEDLSLNLRWEVSERIGLNFDIQKIESSVVNFDNSANSKTAADVNLDISGGKPVFSFDAPTGYGFTAGGFSDPANWFKEWEMEHAEDSFGEELAVRLDADIDIGDGWLDALRVGVRSADRDQQVNWSTYNWGSAQPLWGLQDDVPVFLNQGLWEGTYTPIDLGPDQVGGGVFGGGTFLHPRYDIVNNYDATKELYGNGHSNTWVALSERGCVDPTSPSALYCPVERLDVVEDTRAAYVMLKFGGTGTQWFGLDVKGNIGVRYVTTEVSSTGGAQFPQYDEPSPPLPGQPVDATALISDDDRAFQNNGSYTAVGGDKHSNILPSLNVRLGITDDQFVRVAASRALARADMGLYKFYYTVGVDGAECTDGTVTYTIPGDCSSPPVAWTPRYSADGGNPRLKPTTADQIDLTYEWYFSSAGSFTAALFYKKFNDYIIKASVDEQFTNNDVTRTVNVTRSINADGASVSGFELAYQTFFDKLPAPWNGLGIQTNFTYVNNEGVENSGLSIVSGDGATNQDDQITLTNLPLEGFSPLAYNLVLMFEQEKYSARLAWNWRDTYLISQADCCIKLPIWQDAYGQLDASVHFKPSASWDIFLDAQNLTQQETVLRQQVNQQGLRLPRSWFTNDLRLQLGVRYRIQ